MSAAHWLGLLTLGGSWPFLVPVFRQSPAWEPGLAALVVGALLLGAAHGGAARQAGQATLAGVLHGLWIAALIVLAQLLCLPLLYLLGAHVHRLDILAPLIQGLLNLAGFEAILEQGLVYVQTEEFLRPFSSNWQKLGLFLALEWLIAAAVWLAAVTPSWLRRFALVALLTGVYLVLRFALMITLFTGLGDVAGHVSPGDAALLWDPAVALLSYLPLPLLLAKFLADTPPPPPLPEPGTSAPWRGRVAAGGLLALGGLLGVYALQFEAPGVTKSGRVLFDDFHSGRWESSVQVLDTEGYGSDYLYTYYSLVGWLRHYYPVDVNETERLTPALLADYSILVLKTPTLPFTEAEIEAVDGFVREGGGLFLIGDHTNLLGMTTFLNQVAERFGMRFRYDASNALSTNYFSTFDPPVLFAHPIVQGLSTFHFLTSCTLDSDFSTRPVMIGRDLISDPMDYSKPSFFGDLVPDTASDVGLFLLASAARHGAGRVAAFADSTVFSNFSVFRDGHAEFFLRTLDYLNRRNGLLEAWLPYGLGALAILCLGLGGRRLRALPRLAALSVAILGLTGGAAAGAWSLKAVHQALYPDPRPVTPYDPVAFVHTPWTDYYLPAALGPYVLPPEKSFDALFVIPQRFGRVPRVVTSLAPLGEGMKAAVLINPTDAAPAAAVAALADYVKSGGRLLILRDELAGERFIKAFRRALGGSEQVTEQEVGEDPRTPLEILLTGIPKQTEPVSLTTLRAGTGQAGVLSRSALFSRARMGHVQDRPDAAQLQLYQVAYRAFAPLVNARDGLEDSPLTAGTRPSADASPAPTP